MTREKETQGRTVRCQDCGWAGTQCQCATLRDPMERVLPGDEMPAGECPRCGAAAMLEPLGA